MHGLGKNFLPSLVGLVWFFGHFYPELKLWAIFENQQLKPNAS